MDQRQHSPAPRLGRKEKPSARKAEACRKNATQYRPGATGWDEQERESRIRAVKKLRLLTETAAEKIAAMLEQPLDPLELAALARVVFDRGGVPALTQTEFVGDQIPQTLVIVKGRSSRPAAGETATVQ